MYQPPIPDKAGRGGLCAAIDAIAKDVLKARREGATPDPETLNRLLHLLDDKRMKLHRLYHRQG